MNSPDDTVHETIATNVGASLLANIFYLVSRLFIPPFILSYVSLAEYGLWSYCFIIIGYLGMTVFGITNVYIRFIAVYAAKNETVKINQVASTGVFSIALLSVVVAPFAWFVLPKIFSLFNISLTLQNEGFLLMYGTILIFIIDLTFGVYGYILHSLQRIVIEKIIWVISYTLETIFIIAFLMLGLGIYSLLWAFCVRTVIACVLYASVCYKLLPGLSIKPQFFSKHVLKDFLHFGGIVQLSGIFGIVNRSIEKVLAGITLGAEATGLYEVGEKFPVMSLLLPGSINSVLLPATAHLHAHDQKEKIIAIYIKGTRWINILTGCMMGFMASFAPIIIVAWLGTDPKYSIAAQILAFFTIAYQMDVITGPASAIYRSINEPAKELIYGILQFVLVVTAACLGFYFYGYSILVINVSVMSMMILASIIYLNYTNRNLKIERKPFLKNVLAPGLIPYLMGVIVFHFSSLDSEVFTIRWKAVLYLGIGFIVYSLLMLLILYRFICTSEESYEVKSRLKKMITCK